MPDKISSLDIGYLPGDLSIYPEAIDDYETLYEAKNNARSVLKQALPFAGKQIIIEDASSFPSQGLVRLGPPPGTPGNAELVYYDKVQNNVLKDLIRGFAGSRQNQWPAKTTHVTNAVMAEHHNAVKDAILNIEREIGTSINPDSTSIHGRLKALEDKHLAPRPSFRAFPKRGVPPLPVTFHSFSEGHVVRYLWDFGDGSQSVEKNPIHTYSQEGIYTVRLDVITSSGGRGIAIKDNYITIGEEESKPFFYVTPVIGSENTFELVDQSDGDILTRIWIFDDGQSQTITDPNVHSITHTYTDPGEYEPSLIMVFKGQRTKRVFLSEKVIVE